MDNTQLKKEIHEAIEKLPEYLLPHVLNYLNSIQSESPDKKTLREFVDKVFKEDANLLQRLADS